MESLDFMGMTFSPASEEKRLEYEREEIKLIMERKNKEYRESGVGERFFDVTLDDYETDTDERLRAKEMVEKYINDARIGICRTLWLLGNVGTGKTMLATQIIRACGGRFARSYEIDDEVQMSKSFSAKENLVQVIDKYSKYKMLVIDEVGRMPSDAERAYLFRILNNRYEKNLPTVLISNMGKVEFANYIGKALYDRFTENCKSIVFEGDSYRINKRG